MSLVTSPTTGNLIKVGSPEFERLIRLPKYRETFINPTYGAPEGRVSPSGSSPPRIIPPLRSDSIKLPPLRLSPSLYMSGKIVPEPTISLKGIKLPELKKINTVTAKSSLPPLNEIHLKEEKRNMIPIVEVYPSIDHEPHLDAILSMPFYNIPSLKKLLTKTERPSNRAKIQDMIQRQTEKRTNIKGWSVRSPRRGKERHQLMDECSNKCFLLPDMENPGSSKFPICPSPRVTDGKSVCQIDCGAVQAAKIRAAQWNYPEVERKADVILEKCKKMELPPFAGTRIPPSTQEAAKMSLPVLNNTIVLPTSPKSYSLPMSPKYTDLSPSLYSYGKTTEGCGCGDD